MAILGRIIAGGVVNFDGPLNGNAGETIAVRVDVAMPNIVDEGTVLMAKSSDGVHPEACGRWSLLGLEDRSCLLRKVIRRLDGDLFLIEDSEGGQDRVRLKCATPILAHQIIQTA